MEVWFEWRGGVGGEEWCSRMGVVRERMILVEDDVC